MTEPVLDTVAGLRAAGEALSWDLTRALRIAQDYGRHAPGCALGGVRQGKLLPCDCGWDEDQVWAARREMELPTWTGPK